MTELADGVGVTAGDGGSGREDLMKAAPNPRRPVHRSEEIPGVDQESPITSCRKWSLPSMAPWVAS